MLAEAANSGRRHERPTDHTGVTRLRTRRQRRRLFAGTAGRDLCACGSEAGGRGTGCRPQSAYPDLPYHADGIEGMSRDLAPDDALLPGKRVGEFEFLEVLGRGGFGITYLGWDSRNRIDVAIKEYMPIHFAEREADGYIYPATDEDVEDYEWGMGEFLKEARMLVAFNHPNIVPVRKFFEAHGTAYFAMDYLEGQTLFALLRAKGTLREGRLRELLMAILSGLEEVHSADYLHCDIKPGNIMLRRDGTPVLIDFGAAQAATAAHGRIAPIVTKGYSPVEQYVGAREDYGPWTDIYAVGAVLYRGMTGAVPSDARSRFDDDRLVPVGRAARRRYSKELTDAVDWALTVNADERPQSIDEWSEALAGREASSGRPDDPVPPRQERRRPDARPPTWRRWFIAVAAMAAMALAAIAWKSHVD